MSQPHIPAWLEDVIANLVGLHDAEAVFLVGAHARGKPDRATAFELLVIVDNEGTPERGLSPVYRWEAAEGFPAPVKYLRTSLAELMAGAYGASPGWIDLLRSAYALHDPLDYQRRLIAQRAAVRTPGPRTAISSARDSAATARRLLDTGALAAANLAAVRAADALASWLAEDAARSPFDAFDVMESVSALSPGAARGFSEVLLATGPADAANALDHFIDALEASLRLRDEASAN